MSLQLFGDPFSSYTCEVLIALWADETPLNSGCSGATTPKNGNELRRPCR